MTSWVQLPVPAVWQQQGPWLRGLWLCVSLIAIELRLHMLLLQCLWPSAARQRQRGALGTASPCSDSSHLTALWLCSAGAKQEYPWNGALNGCFQRGGRFDLCYTCWMLDPSKHWNSSFSVSGLDFETPVALKVDLGCGSCLWDASLPPGVCKGSQGQRGWQLLSSTEECVF